MIANLFKKAGRLRFSGYNACGDQFEGAGLRTTKKRRLFDVVIDVGRDFVLIEPDGILYITGPGPQQFTTWTPGELMAAARKGWFGFAVLTAR